MLCLLDLSAAFDTVDHAIMLSRLEKMCGISGRALRWLRAYLGGRTQCVKYGGKCSTPATLLYGVPQGSVLGPLLFVLYTAQLDDVARSHNCKLSSYADDNQLYVHCNAKDAVVAASSLERCVAEISGWMASNRLKLNPSKTELMWFSTPHRIANFNKVPIDISSVTINPTTTARSLGVVLDEELKLSKHVASVCRSCYYQLRQLRHIRRYLDLDSATTLVNSFITSRIDYCNSLLAAAPRYQIDELQRVQNSAARLLLKLPKCDRRLRVLVQHRLHWLRVPERITFKLCTLVYRSLHGAAPSYLAELCVPMSGNVYRRHLLSADRGLLEVPRRSLETYGPRAFRIAGPVA